MISQHLADSFGVWGNSRYLLPMQFVSYLEQIIGTTPESNDYDRDVLVWRLDRILRDTTDPELSAVAAYLKGEQSDLKRFQLARQLANLFDQYQIMRPNILEAWAQEKTVSSEPSERWQKSLWQRLCNQSGSILNRGELIFRLLVQLEEEQNLKQKLPGRIFVFGLHTMPPLFLSVLNSLAKRIDVHLFLLSPCELYWGDMESKRVQAKRKLRNFENNIPEEMQLDGPQYHPLLTSLGRQGAHFQELLLDCIENYQEGWTTFVNPLESGTSTVLRRLQADIMAGIEAPESSDGDDVLPDDSIMISSCHSRMRELAVLKDYLLSWLYNDPALKLHDIVVMAPDIQDYAMMVPAVFSDVHHSIADRNTRKRNRYFDIFLQVLGLFSGRYGWSEILSILEKPEVYPRFGMSTPDIDKVRFWITDSGIRWGLSGSQRQRDGFADIEQGSWRNGLDRMLIGFATDTDTIVDGILPYTEIEGGDGEILGGLYQFIDCIEQACASFANEKTLTEWSEALRTLCDLVFIESDNPDLIALIQSFSQLDDDFAPYHEEKVSLAVIRSWLEGNGNTVTSAGFLSGRLTFCSMLPMRSIPFKIICLLGLNEGQYPKNDIFATFDLMGKQYRHGDRSSRADDRYQFLEAIIAARERLYLSYVGQSIKTNEKIPPSVVVAELLETMDQFYGTRDRVVLHALQPSNSIYYTPQSTLFSYDEGNCDVAIALNKESSDLRGWSDISTEKQELSCVDFKEIDMFFRNPQSYFVKNILGVNLSLSEESPEDSEPFALDNLQSYSANRLILESILEKVDSRSVLERFQTKLGWPLGAPGELLFEERLMEIKDFACQVGRYDVGAPVEDIVVDIELDGTKVIGTMAGCYEKGQFLYRYAKLKGKDLLQAWLVHLSAGRVRGSVLPTCYMASDRVVFFPADNSLQGELEYLLQLFLDGCIHPACFFVEPAFAYAEQVRKNRKSGKKSPMETARKEFKYIMENGYLPEWTLLYQNQKSYLLN